MGVIVHEDISQRRPELSEPGVRRARANAFLVQERFEDDLPCATLVTLGTDARGRPVEMVAVTLEDGTALTYHAMTLPKRKVLRELKRKQR